MLTTLINYLFYSSSAFFLSPNSSSICKTTEVCPISWDNNISSHAHLEVQVQRENGNWSGTTLTGKSFLSIIVDETTTDYNWIVPQYLGQYWESPKRVVLEELDTKTQYISDDFVVPGVTLLMNRSQTQPLESTESIELSWATNDNTVFGLYLLDGSQERETIHNATLKANSSFIWTVPYRPSQSLQILIESIDANTYTLSEAFEIATTTTTTSTTTTTTTTTTTNNTAYINPAPVDNSIPEHWVIVIIIVSVIVSIGTIVYFAQKSIMKQSHQQQIYPSIRGTGHNNPIYDTGRIPTISPPSDFRIVTGYSMYSNAPCHPSNEIQTSYNHLQRLQTRTIQNDNYQFH
jgi:hypothetical protein